MLAYYPDSGCNAGSLAKGPAVKSIFHRLIVNAASPRSFGLHLCK
jgi:hypothetical protein